MAVSYSAVLPSVSNFLQHTVRSASENKERAYIAASRRGDRSIEARVASAHEASKIHKERTGKSLKITQSIVEAEEMYEEEEDAPRHFAYNLAHLPGRFQTYAAVHMGIAGEAAKIERDFEKYFGHQLHASQGVSAAHLQYGAPPMGSALQGSIPITASFDPRTQVTPGQELAATPMSPAFARATPPGPLQIPDNNSFLGLETSPQLHSSPFTPGINVTGPGRRASSQHAPSPGHVSSPAISFGDHTSPMSTSSHYASPLQTPVHESSPTSATFERSRSGSNGEQYHLSSFDGAQIPEHASHGVTQNAARHSRGSAAQRSLLQRQQSFNARSRQQSEGSIYGSQSIAQRMVNGNVNAISAMQRRLSEHSAAFNQPSQVRFEPSIFTPELPANVQALIYGTNQEGNSGVHPTRQTQAMGPPASVPPRSALNAEQFSPNMLGNDAGSDSQEKSRLPDHESSIARSSSTANSTDPNIDSQTSALTVKSETDEDGRFTQPAKQSGVAAKTADNDFSQFLFDGGIEFPYSTSLVDNSIGVSDDSFFNGTHPFDVSDNSFEFNMDDFVDFPQSQPTEEDNLGGSN